jgi:hypothetical protein
MIATNLLPYVFLLLHCACFSGRKEDDKGVPRLQCLQKPLGSKGADHWTKGRIREPSPLSNDTDFEWVYQNKQCPLNRFNLSVFCKSSLGCGKNMLIVGDSTSSSLIDFWAKHLPHRTKHLICSTDNHCANRRIHGERPEQKRGCVVDPNSHIAKHRYSYVCSNECNQEDSSQIAFQRHDFLMGAHGEFYFQSTVCEQWWSRAKEADIIVLSFGPHIHNMATYPDNQPAQKDFNVLSLVKKTARDVSLRLKSLLKSGAVVVYRTAHHGNSKFNADCELKPLASVNPPETLYSWNLIPRVHEIYIKYLKEQLGQHLLVMNHQNLLNMRVGCRGDPLHFDTSKWNSPVAIDWQVLQNILEAYHAQL